MHLNTTFSQLMEEAQAHWPLVAGGLVIVLAGLGLTRKNTAGFESAGVFFLLLIIGVVFAVWVLQR